MMNLNLNIQNLIVAFALGFFAFSTASATQSISSYKDKEFKHPRVLNSGFGGDFQEIYYDELEHVNGRDQVPGVQALRSRVTLLDHKYFRLNSRIGGVNAHQLGNIPSAKFVVVFIHGADGSADLGFNDWSFGGNFNRLKNLVLYNRGAYLSPSIRIGSSRASSSVGSLIDGVLALNRAVKVIVACASAGGEVCWDLASSKSYSSKISGLVLLGTAFDMPRANLPYVQLGKPLVFAHGSRDPRVSAAAVYDSFASLKAIGANYPAKYYMYRGGNHGNPIRMIDWRQSLNFIL